MGGGALGTAEDPKTTAYVQIVDWNGNSIPGLRATGSAMAAMLGDVYGGAGGAGLGHNLRIHRQTPPRQPYLQPLNDRPWVPGCAPS